MTLSEGPNSVWPWRDSGKSLPEGKLQYELGVVGKFELDSGPVGKTVVLVLVK